MCLSFSTITRSSFMICLCLNNGLFTSFWKRSDALTISKSPCFLTFFMVLPYTLLLINLNKSLSKSCLAFFLFSVLNSMNGFRKFACLKLIALWTFQRLNPCCKQNFNADICKTYFFLYIKFNTNLFVFSSLASFP